MQSTLRHCAILSLLVCLTSGCSTLETAADHTRDFAKAHPVVTAVGTAVVVGGIVYGLDHHHHHDGRQTCAPTGSLLGTTLEEVQSGCRQ